MYSNLTGIKKKDTFLLRSSIHKVLLKWLEIIIAML